jgi:hypothetical protein
MAAAEQKLELSAAEPLVNGILLYPAINRFLVEM